VEPWNSGSLCTVDFIELLIVSCYRSFLMHDYAILGHYFLILVIIDRNAEPTKHFAIDLGGLVVLNMLKIMCSMLCVINFVI